MNKEYEDFMEEYNKYFPNKKEFFSAGDIIKRGKIKEMVKNMNLSEEEYSRLFNK